MKAMTHCFKQFELFNFSFLHCRHVDFVATPCCFQALRILCWGTGPPSSSFFFLFPTDRPKIRKRIRQETKKKRGWPKNKIKSHGPKLKPANLQQQKRGNYHVWNPGSVMTETSFSQCPTSDTWKQSIKENNEYPMWQYRLGKKWQNNCFASLRLTEKKFHLNGIQVQWQMCTF